MLYEMLTGFKPHSGESPIQVAYKHVHEDIGAPSSLQPGIPKYVDALVARATVRDRDQRSTDARVMLQQVRSVQRAIAAGLDEDPDLEADLRPGGRVDDDAEARTVSVPRAATVLGAGVGSSTAAFSTVDEHTMQWSAAAPVAAAAPPLPPRPAEPAAKSLGLDPPMSREQYGDSGGKKHSRRGRYLLIGALVVALLAGLLTYYFTTLRYDETPVLIGSTETVAQDNAKTAGFSFEIAERAFSETAPTGTVISTDPEPGEKILPGDTIEAVVSKGRDRVFIPDNNLTGMRISEAKAALAEQDLTLGERKRVYDEDIAKDLIVRADGVTSTDALKRGEAVNVLVSKGRKPITVKSYVGSTLATAKDRLEGAGFKVTSSEAFSDTVPSGSVISQSPDGGTQFRNDTINLVVSKGPELITIPDVRGMKKADARRTLQEAGFDVFSVYIPLAGNFIVQRQLPAGGDKAERGSRVTISPI
jgi:serine/threonine-protein kinase